MDEKRSSNFTIGFLIGLLLCIILWYWQKSTAAEDGALDLLERYAARERQWREKGSAGETAVLPSPPPPSAAPAFDFNLIKGIGPTFSHRLQETGITTLVSLRALAPDTLAELLNIGVNRAQAILLDAQTFQNA